MGQETKLIEDKSKTSGKFKLVEIEKEVLAKNDNKYKNDFSYFSVVIGGLCKVNSNWIKKNEELVCIKCEGSFCKEFSPSKSLTMEDLKNPFYKNFFIHTTRLNYLIMHKIINAIYN